MICKEKVFFVHKSSELKGKTFDFVADYKGTAI